MIQSFRIQCSRSPFSVSKWMTRLGHWSLVALLAIALWAGTAIHPSMVHAATTPEAEAYDVGPIRKTRNPLSGENFHGGVDASALDQTESRRAPNDEDKNVFETLIDKVTGNQSTEAPMNFEAEKNPTLERYPKALE